MSEGQENKAVIRTPDRLLRVFVSSALGELAEERRAVSRAISALRLTPVMFDPRPLPVSMPTTIPYYLGRPARVRIAAMPLGKSQPKTQHDDDSAAWACTRQTSAARSHPED